jgi:predicted PurR-regulated permease PerM/methanogenic corrinoid protein MtbC1
LLSCTGRGADSSNPAIGDQNPGCNAFRKRTPESGNYEKHQFPQHIREATGGLMGNEILAGSAHIDQASVRLGKPRNPTSDLHATVVHDFNQEPNLPADDRDDGLDDGGITRPILAIIVATVVLYFGKDILLPLVMASILAVAFSPITSRLEVFVGRFLSAALMVGLAITAIGAIGFFLTVQLTSVAVEVAGYSNNIAAKLTRLQGSTPAWLQTVEDGVKDVEQQLQKTGPELRRPPRMVQTQVAPAAVDEVLKPFWPIISGLGEALLIIVLLFFLLYARADLRDRLVRLAARARIPVAALAIETATGAVGRYLLLLSLTNLAFGIAIGIAAWLLGLPDAAFWGALTFVLRFIPYVGALSAAVLPTLVAFAVFPGWSRSFAMLGCFLIMDQVTNQLVEPFLIGRGIGVSPVALLVSAMYWSWLWGVPGLTTPLAACLKVAGDYIPELGFFAILLGADSGKDDYHDYHRMLLELNESGARTLATDYCDTHGLEATFDDVLIPALTLAGQERMEGHISQENQHFLVEVTRGLITDLGNRFIKPRTKPRLRILGICAPGEVHDLGLLMLLELLRHSGAAANLIDQKTPGGVRDFLKRYAPDMVCLSCTMTECLPAAAELVRDIKLDSPDLVVIGGGPAAVSSPAELLKAGCSQICASRGDARRVMRRFALWRAESRRVGAVPCLNPPVNASDSISSSPGNANLQS